MKRFFIVFTTLTILFVTFSALRPTKAEQEEVLILQQEAEEISKKGVLTVAVDENMPGYFNYRGCGYGFQHDILRQYAKSLGIELNIVEKKSINNAMKLLSDNSADIVVTMSRYKDLCGDKVETLAPIYKTNYVILANSSAKRELSTEELKDIVKQKSVVISQGFTATKGYNFWLDSINNSAVISFSNTLDMIKAVDKGEVDYFVCEKMEARLGCFINKGVKEVYSFKEEVNSILLVDSNNKSLAHNFNAWLESYKESDQYKKLYALYYDSGFLKQLATEGFVAPIGDISPYDEIIKRESLKAGRDWRLVSAIAYNESRFNPTISSPRSAQGLMQIMPAIARQFDMTTSEMNEPEKNIEVALKLINTIESSLRFSANTSEYDKLCIILACYNGGIGHVMDARRLATKYGDNPNRWDSVAKYLTLKNHETYYTDAAVKSGKFSGRETLAFVDKVMNKYGHYCKTVEK